MSVCPRTHMEQLCFHSMDFREIWYLSISRKSVEKIQVSLKPDKNDGALHLKTFIHLWFYLVLEWETFQTKVVETIKTRILCWGSFVVFENLAVYEVKVEEYGTARQATYDSIIRRMRIACWIPNDKTYEQNMYCVQLFDGNSGEANAPLCCFCICIACFASACTEEFFVHTCIHLIL